MALSLEWVEMNKKQQQKAALSAAAAAGRVAGKTFANVFNKILIPAVRQSFPPLTITSTPVNSNIRKLPAVQQYSQSMQNKKDEALIALDYFETHEKLHGTKTSTLMQICDALPSTITLSDEGPWIAGGAVRRWYTGIPQDGDVDFFFANEEQFNHFCRELDPISEISKNTNQFNTTFRIAVTSCWSIDVQAISYRFFENVYKLLRSFDFTVSQLAFDGKTIHTFERTIKDNEKRVIKFDKISCGILSLLRIGKHMKQGYTMSLEDTQTFLEYIRDHPDRIQGPLISGTARQHQV